MEHLSDDDIVREILSRLKAKDRANHDLIVVTKKLEALNSRLLESEKLKSNFLSNIRNEVNNPLTSVLTLCDILLTNGGTEDAETVKSIVSSIHKEAFYLSFQMRNIFAAAELEAGEALFGASSVDVGSLIRSTMDSFQHRALEKGISVSFVPDDKLKQTPVFSTDPEKFQIIVMNLLANAIEYSHEGGAVEIRAWRDNAALGVSVADQGIGIDEADREIIFERFKQLDSGSSKRHGGHGLGLSITKAALELIGGRITVGGKAGGGSVFTVSVPEAAPGAGAFSDNGNDFFFKDGGHSERF
ncbi:MAG: HAMP domain-containing histidine kinase [Deltaproteobacteria bacterium]|nr:HAMP domain-containing histidine kinase [Deltaproteobacteria bacterium]